MTDEPIDPRERRVHARIHVKTDVEVSDASGMHAVELRDISHGGAQFFTPSRPGKAGDSMELFIPGPDGEDIGVVAEIVRVMAVDDGYLVAVRFALVEPNKRDALNELLGLLLDSTGGGAREHPRVARRISVRCETNHELLSMVENISEGGMSMNLTEALVLDEVVLVVLPDSEGEDLLTLSARVANQRAVPGTDPPEYLVGLDFDDMTPERSALLDALLVFILKTT